MSAHEGSSAQEEWERAAVSEEERKRAEQAVKSGEHTEGCARRRATAGICTCIDRGSAQPGDRATCVAEGAITVERRESPGTAADRVPPARTIGVVGMELEAARADVIRYRAAVELDAKLTAELAALLEESRKAAGVPTRRRRKKAAK